MEEKETKCTLCKERVAYGKDGEVVCWYIGQPDEKKCPSRKQPVSEQPTNPDPQEDISSGVQMRLPDPPAGVNTLSKEAVFEPQFDWPLEPLHLSEPPAPPDQFPPPFPPSTTRPTKRRGLALFLFIIIILLLVGSGVLADYTLQLHSQILSLNSTIGTQAATIRNGQAALAATNQAQGVVIQNVQTTQTALAQQATNVQATQTVQAQQLSNLEATSTAIATDTPLGAIPDGQTPNSYPTVSVGQAVFITFTLKNTGTDTWSNQGGFSFNCTSNSSYHSDAISNGWMPVCPNPGKLIFINGGTVSTGQTYTFSFYFPTSSLSAGNTYVTYWRLSYNSLPFGTEVYMKVTVQ